MFQSGHIKLASKPVIKQKMNRFLMRKQALDQYIEKDFTATTVHVQGIEKDHGRKIRPRPHSTVTLFAKFRG